MHLRSNFIHFEHDDKEQKVKPLHQNNYDSL